MMPTRHFALIPAAGVGLRMGADCPKQYLHVAGKPVLRHTVDAFLSSPAIEHVFIVVSPDDGWVDEAIPSGREKVTVLRCGGKTRRDSVLNGLDAIADRVGPHDWVLVHDAARPGLTPALIGKLIAVIDGDPVGGLLALPVADTVKRSGPGRLDTLSREGLWLAQTPQAFRHELLVRALRGNADVTDEAGAVEALGLVPKLVEGHARNNKVTMPADMELVEMFLAARTMENKPDRTAD
jgi:2-C-methyl-D-erythritol 4-phosphate cytidylyltransferase